MKNAQAKTVYRKDYKPTPYLIHSTDLHFSLFEDHALVSSELCLYANGAVAAAERSELRFDGHELDLQAIGINGKALADHHYVIDEDGLTLVALDQLLNGAVEFRLSITTRIEPQNNTALEGLYKSKKMFCTQCEAEGFRRITYYLDRPDVMSVFTTTVEAEISRYPVLLSNGNKLESGADSQGRHWVKWHDPFPKPSYLFALVAGDLQAVRDSFTTVSGRSIDLQIFVEAKDLDKCDHAMESLKKAMSWDEEVYGREYDLDLFMIVAVDDFNMGAMENKGLNIFNTSCVLANPATTTDAAFQRVEAVVAHEYFHNWSGNRVTCRDWFQLSLKEGFTVFRDSEFSADMGSRVIKRIEDASFLRTVQFAEDSGPMAHSVRPDSYMEISNFYTVTIYEKGAEVVRMIYQLLGEKNFRAGSDLYFARHDGQAVTTEEFVKAMEDASGVDLTLFRNWYGQAGTPELTISSQYDEDDQAFTLKVSQSCPATPGGENNLPFHIPLKLGLLGQGGDEFDLQLRGSGKAPQKEMVLDVMEAEQEYVFENVPSLPVPSLLRSFSAPVRLNYEYQDDDLQLLLVHDSDGFNRWNAGQSLATKLINAAVADFSASDPVNLPPVLEQAFGGILDEAITTLDSAAASDELDLAMIAQLLSLPAVGTLIEQSKVADVQAIHCVRSAFCDQLAKVLYSQFSKLLSLVTVPQAVDEEFDTSAAAVAKRALRNLCLSYLVRSGDEAAIEQCYGQYNQAKNMTDQSAALRMLVHSDHEKAKLLGEEALQRFYLQWQDEALVTDLWFAIQATSPASDCLDTVKELLQHPGFDIRNPNKVRSVISAFCMQNHCGFHDEAGMGYQFLADQVIQLNAINPQIAARLLTPFTRWKKYPLARQELIKAQLQRVKDQEALSKDVFEIVEKSLQG